MSLTISKDKKQEKHITLNFEKVSCSMALGNVETTTTIPKEKNMIVELRSISIIIVVPGDKYRFKTSRNIPKVFLETTPDFDCKEIGRNIKIDDLEKSKIKSIEIYDEDITLKYEQGKYLYFENRLGSKSIVMELEFKNKTLTIIKKRLKPEHGVYIDFYEKTSI